MVGRRAGGPVVSGSADSQDIRAILETQRTAGDPAASAWVSASAGTGKTYILTERVLRLLLAGAAPERILCLTFTKAAASEMANRLHERLADWIALDDDSLAEAIFTLVPDQPRRGTLDDARRLFARALETPGGLKIQTIHAFCESVLRRFPIEAGLPPHFDVADERTAGEMLDEARDRVIERLEREDPADLDTVMAAIDEEGFRARMADLARERQRLAGLPEDPSLLAGAVDAVFGLEAGDTDAALLAGACGEAEIDADALRAAVAALATGGKTDQARGAAIAGWLAATPGERARLWDDYLTHFLIADGGIRKTLATKPVRDALPGVEDTLADEAERIQRIVERRKARAIADHSAALLRLGRRLLAGYEAEKATRALLDYDDLVLRTRALLREGVSAAWVLFKLDGGIDHILVDEAQDTNPEQWDVIVALADEFFAGEGARPESRTMFAVGDPKQSIYGFQRADPEAFLAMRDRFAGASRAAERPWHAGEFTVSFRSARAVLAFVDRVFADPGARDGLLAERIAHRPRWQGRGGLVEVWPLEEQPEADAVEGWAMPETPESETPDAVAQLAERIARTIAGWLAGPGEWLETRERPMRAGDVLILVQRRRPLLDAVVAALKRHRVPVAGADRLGVTEELAVRDLLAAARFMLLPEDDYTLACLLKSPLVGFDDARLFALAHGRGETSLWQVLRERAGGDARLAELVARLETWRTLADRIRPFELFARLLGREGGRRALLARLGPQADEPIAALLDLALDFERQNAPSLQGFLAWLDAGDSEIKREQDVPRDEVRVMTVHGAKGLEAPVVFLADTVRLPDKTHAGSLFWPPGVEDASAPPLWIPRTALADAGTLGLREAAHEALVRENRRLFYVALTRAADRLYVCGWKPRKSAKSAKSDIRNWHEMAQAAIESLGGTEKTEDGREIWRYREETSEPAAPPPVAAEAAETAALPDWILRPAPPDPVPPRPLAPSRPEYDEPSADSPLSGDGAARFRRGILLHELLQRLPELPEAERAGAAERYLAAAGGGLPAAAAAELARECCAVLAHPDFSALFGPGSRAEAPLAGLVGNRVISGTVDRLLVTDSRILLIDYKSNRPPPEDPAAVAPLYLRQMAAYRAVLRQAFPGRPVACALLWTAVPRLMPLCDSLLDPHDPA